MADLQELRRTLLPLHEPLGTPGPGDWLDMHREAGQDFADYVESEPTVPDGGRSTIYIQPLGQFAPAQRRVVERTARFVESYFCTPTCTAEPLPLSLVPQAARRRSRHTGTEQVLTGYILREVLIPRVPPDAAAYIAFTAGDLWPGPGWNFVFGQASLRHRVGVWSIYRNGDPQAGPEAFRLCLLRTMKTGTHELGHMFGMAHCVRFRCNMNGSNSRAEADRRPLALCPVDLTKLAWGIGFDPLERFRRLAAFCREQDLQQEGQFYERSAAALKDGRPQ